MTGNDPTDQALAVIASIFEKPDAKLDERGEATAEQDAHAPDQPPPAAEAAAAEIAADETDEATDEATDEDQSWPAVAVADTDPAAFTRYGPGPLDALRFKWSLRFGEAGYYVDETIGTASQPISSGPMSRTDAIAFIETRERDALRRYEELRNEIVMGPSERGGDEDGDELDAAR